MTDNSAFALRAEAPGRTWPTRRILFALASVVVLAVGGTLITRAVLYPAPTTVTLQQVDVGDCLTTLQPPLLRVRCGRPHVAEAVQDVSGSAGSDGDDQAADKQSCSSAVRFGAQRKGVTADAAVTYLTQSTPLVGHSGLCFAIFADPVSGSLPRSDSD